MVSIPEKDYQIFFNFINKDKKSWTSKLFFFVEKQFDKFLEQINRSTLPININRSESLVQFYHNVLTTINLAGTEKNPYIDISLSSNNKVKVKLKRSAITVLIEFMFYAGYLFLGNKTLELSLVELIKAANHGKKFPGKKIKDEDEEKYNAELKIKADLFHNKGKSSHQSGYSAAVREYSRKNNLHWSTRKIKTETQKLSNYDKKLK